MARNAARDSATFDAFGLTYAALCMLVVTVARWRDGEQLTAYRDVQAFIDSEEGFARIGHLLSDLERLRLVQRRRLVGKCVYFAPTSIALARVGWAGRTEAA